MGEKISVIVPIYKVEEYLHRCIDSIINQTYTNLEIIIVDDGSPDNCPMICDEYAKKDSRIRVIHKKNGGLSDARNAGLEIATGEYIGFVDSDDWIHKDMYHILYKNIIEKDADIAECSIKKERNYIEDFDIPYKYDIFSYTKLDAMGALISEDIIKQTVWNKLYRKKVIDSIMFEKGKLHEDEFWTYQVLNKCEKLVHMEIDLYYYFQREDSIMGERYSIKRLDAIEGRYKRYLFIKEKYPSLTSKAKKNLFFISIYYLQQAINDSDKESLDKSYKSIKKYISTLNFRFNDYKNMNLQENVWVCLSKVSLIFCCKIRNHFNIGV